MTVDWRELVRAVRRLELRTQRRVLSRLAGAYASVFHGRGLEFAEVRPYVPGDDVRRLDWNVTARLGAPFVRTYVEERQLTLLLLVDVSGSLDWGTVRWRREWVAEVAAAFALTAARHHDRVGLVAWTDRVELAIRPGVGRRHALRLLRDLLALAPSGRGSDLAPALRLAQRVLPSRSAIVIVSDWIGVASGWERPLRGLAQRHEVLALRLPDPAEGGVPLGVWFLEDPESGQRRRVRVTEGLRRAWGQALEAERQRVRVALARAGAGLWELPIERPWVPVLRRYLDARARRR